MKTNYFSFDLFPQNGAGLANPISTSLSQVIQHGMQTVWLNNAFFSIHHLSGDVFMFLKTNNTDIIKTIDRVTNRYQDITALLQQNEDVAFASYVIASNNCIGFSSTLFGPKIGAFATYYDH